MKMLADAALLDRGGLYSRIGDLFAWACLLAVAALSFKRPRRLAAASSPRRIPTKP
jgi:hypothetical protein